MKLIDKAIDLLREHGWIRGAARTVDGFCISGALEQAALDLHYANGLHTCKPSNRERAELLAHGTVASRDLDRARHLVDAAINRHTCGGWTSTVPWNDHGCRDADEAIEVMKLASERCDD